MTELHLVARRTIAASPSRLFAAWTEPSHIERWWGPPPVRCAGAQVDLRVGGLYRIGNQMPDGELLWITGRFEAIEPPHRLVYSWAHEPVDEETRWTRVTVRFEPVTPDRTEVIIVHERFVSEEIRQTHEVGWSGCLDGLERWLEHYKSAR